MPTNVKRKSRYSKGNTKLLTEWKRDALLRGGFDGVIGDTWIDGRAFDSLEEARACWNAHRRELLPKFIDQNPGRRPLAWWEFDHPEVQRQMVGQYSWPDQHGIWMIEPVYELPYECLKRAGHLLEGEQISEFDAEEIKKRDKLITDHQKRLNEIPAEKFKESDRLIHEKQNAGKPRMDVFQQRDSIIFREEKYLND